MRAARPKCHRGFPPDGLRSDPQGGTADRCSIVMISGQEWWRWMGTGPAAEIVRRRAKEYGTGCLNGTGPRRYSSTMPFRAA